MAVASPTRGNRCAAGASSETHLIYRRDGFDDNLLRHDLSAAIGRYRDD